MGNLEKTPMHIGVILDGNRRWAKNKGMRPEQGHIEGTKRLQGLLENCQKYGVKYLTLYCFSTENFKRSETELKVLFRLFEKLLHQYTKEAKEKNIKVTIYGDRSKFNKRIVELCDKVEELTKDCKDWYLNICLNYGGKSELTMAAKKIAEKVQNGELLLDAIDENTVANELYSKGMPEVDLVIRTSGEQRLSNFLPWQTTYAELYFPEVCFPDFKDQEFNQALKEYDKRHRRFGGG